MYLRIVISCYGLLLYLRCFCIGGSLIDKKLSLDIHILRDYKFFLLDFCI